jgi:hypothetical protein
MFSIATLLSLDLSCDGILQMCVRHLCTLQFWILMLVCLCKFVTFVLYSVIATIFITYTISTLWFYSLVKYYYRSFAINLCISLHNFGTQTLGDRDHIHVYGFWWSITKGLHHAHFFKVDDYLNNVPRTRIKIKKSVLQWLTLLHWLPLIIFGLHY